MKDLTVVRFAEKSDIKAIKAVYAAARRYMEDNGNPTQWGKHHPPAGLTVSDIENSRLYVVETGGRIHGVFAFIIGDDPMYSVIEDGGWRYDKPYGTIHRIASDGTVGGVFGECMRFAKSQIDYLRIDTHRDNRIMLHCIAKHGFERSGIVCAPDGSPRIAFEYMSLEKTPAVSFGRIPLPS